MYVHWTPFSACVSLLRRGEIDPEVDGPPGRMSDGGRCRSQPEQPPAAAVMVTQGDGERSGICFSLRSLVQVVAVRVGIIPPATVAEMRLSAGRDSSRLADKADGIRPSASDALSVSFRPGARDGIRWTGWDGMGVMSRILCDWNNALCQRKARQLKRKREARWKQDVEKETPVTSLCMYVLRPSACPAGLCTWLTSRAPQSSGG